MLLQMLKSCLAVEVRRILCGTCIWSGGRSRGCGSHNARGGRCVLFAAVAGTLFDVTHMICAWSVNPMSARYIGSALSTAVVRARCLREGDEVSAWELRIREASARARARSDCLECRVFVACLQMYLGSVATCRGVDKFRIIVNRVLVLPSVRGRIRLATGEETDMAIEA